ncbi:MAG: hypothetical protein WBA67_07295 [Jannaschia sp.]
MIRSLALCLALAACGGSVPSLDTTISDGARGQPFPRLEPIDALLTEAARPSRAVSEQDILAARGSSLARRGIAPPAGGSLEDRGQRLRDRAAQLRAVAI